MKLTRLVLAALLCAALTACASVNTAAIPQPPNDAILARAETMLEKADAAGAGRFAPDALSSARYRLTVARMILYRKVGSSIDTAERQRLQRLARAAYLDARLALVRSRLSAVQQQGERLASRLDPETPTSNNGEAR